MSIIQTIKKIFKKSSVTSKKSDPSKKNNQESNEKTPLHKHLNINIQKIKESVGNSTDIGLREFVIPNLGNLKAAVFFTEGLVDLKSINDFIMKTLMLEIKDSVDKKITNSANRLQLIKENVLVISDMNDAHDYETLLSAIISGEPVLLIDGYTQGFLFGMKSFEERGVQEPSTQTVIRGPKEGFSETLRTNTALIRRKIKNPKLWLETQQIGRITKTDVSIMYIKDLVQEKVLEEVRKRLNRIDIDGILESGYIEELIQDETYTPFPTIYNTERPDVVAAALLEGRIAILVDGTPFVLLVPTLFGQFFHAAEDYYQRADIGTLLRILRYISLAIALLGPSMYIAIITFHQEMLPTQLIISLAAQREGVPFPAFVEAMMMEVTFEILREAGVRMPRAVGQSVSIVGALVLGQAAVEAGIISSSMVIVVSITAIASFVLPAFNMSISIRILRFILMALAASFGLFGITLGLIAIVLHLSSLRSFGVPYMSPFGPFIPEDQKDMIVRVPFWGMFSRPRFINQKNVIREQNSPTTKPKS